MRYIQKLYIKNFQSHKNTVIELSPELNILVGESDQGKSSIIRALRWLFYNYPRGEDFIRVGENFCEVKAEMSDGVKISRIRQRGGKTNSYVIEYPDWEREPLILEKFGYSVPDEVQKELGNGRLYYDTDKFLDINIAHQLEAPFLLSESAPDKAKIIGLIADLDVIDAAGREVLQDIRQANLRQKNLQEEVEKLAGDLQQYNDLEDKKKILEQGRQILGEIDKKERLILILEDLQKEWKKQNEEIRVNDKKLEKLEEIDSAENYYIKAIEKNNRLTRLSELNQGFIQLQAEIKKCTQRLAELEVTEGLYSIQDNIKKLLEMFNNLSHLENRQYMIKNTLQDINRVLQNTEELNQIETVIEVLTEKRNSGAKMQDLRKQIKEYKTEMVKVMQVISSTDNIEVLEQIRENFKNNLQMYYEYEKIRIQYENGLREYNQNLENLNKIEEKYDMMMNEYIKVLKEAGRCPTCNTQITEDTINQIISSISLSAGEVADYE